MKNTVFIGFLALLVVSCGPEGPEMQLQYPLITEQKMTDIVYELQRVEAVHAVRSYKDSLATPLMLHRVQQIMEAHGVSTAQFEESLRYYQELGKPLEDIYGRAIDRANVDMAKAEAEEIKE
jgi:hypothetical protein